MSSHLHMPARVNIVLENGNRHAQEKKELPMRLLVLADFLQIAQAQSLSEQERITVTLASLQALMQYLKPSLSLSLVDDKHEAQAVELSFESLKDFEPESLIRQVPDLRRLAAMQSLLRELRANLINNHQFKQRLQSLFANKQQVHACHQQLLEMHDE